MSNVRAPEAVLRKPVACWLTDKDYGRLLAAANSYGIRVAVFIRATLIDALADEDDRMENKKSIAQQIQPIKADMSIVALDCTG